MEAQTRALHTLAPLSYRRFAGAIADVWQVHGEQDGGGYYIAPDPRLVIFLDDTPPPMTLRLQNDAPEERGVQAFYIPPGVPLWSRMEAGHDMSHIDFHLEASALHRRLAASGVHVDLASPRMICASPELLTLARLAAQEVRNPRRGEMMLDGLLSALLGEIFATSEPAPPRAAGGLSPYQFTAVERHLRANLNRQVPVAELADVAGLSPGWFSHAFKQGRNETPQRWQARMRLDVAREMIETGTLPLAEIAQSAGFSDQAHLSRQFRAAHGMPPSAWRRNKFQAD